MTESRPLQATHNYCPLKDISNYTTHYPETCMGDERLPKEALRHLYFMHKQKPAWFRQH